MFLNSCGGDGEEAEKYEIKELSDVREQKTGYRRVPLQADGLTEDMEVTSGGVQQLKLHLKELEKQINQTARKSQILFMETGLEVEGAKVAVQRRVEELAGNLSQHEQRLQEMDVDVDYLYTVFYKHNSSTDCDCKALKAAVANLERGVANVTELVNENKMALDENSVGGAEPWGGASDWEPAAEALQRGLQQVRPQKHIFLF